MLWSVGAFFGSSSEEHVLIVCRAYGLIAFASVFLSAAAVLKNFGAKVSLADVLQRTFNDCAK